MQSCYNAQYNIINPDIISYSSLYYITVIEKEEKKGLKERDRDPFLFF